MVLNSLLAIYMMMMWLGFCVLFYLKMSGYIKYFDNGRKNMSFMIEDEIVYLKYTRIWNKIKSC